MPKSLQDLAIDGALDAQGDPIIPGLDQVPSADPQDPLAAVHAVQQLMNPAPPTNVQDALSSEGAETMQPDQGNYPVAGRETPGDPNQAAASGPVPGSVVGQPAPISPQLPSAGTPGAPPPAPPPPLMGAAPAPTMTSIDPATGKPVILSPDELAAQQDSLDKHAAATEAQSQHEQANAAEVHRQAELDQLRQDMERDRTERADFEFRRGVDHANAQRETHEMMERVDSAVSQNPDPSHYFSGSGGSLRRVLWFMAIAANAYANKKHPERANQMLNMMRSEIDADMHRQNESIERKMKGLDIERHLLSDNQATRASDLRSDHEARILRNLSLSRYAHALAAAPGPADQRAGMAMVAAHLDQESAKHATKFGELAYAAREKETQQAFDMRKTKFTESQSNYRTAVEQSGQDQRQQAGFLHDKEMAPITASAKAAGAGQEALAKRVAEQDATDPGLTGLAYRDKLTGKVRPIPIDAPKSVKAGEEAAKLANLTKDYHTLAKAADESDFTNLLKTDPAVRAAAFRVAAQDTKRSFSRTTNTEFTKALEADAPGLGLNMQNVLTDLAAGSDVKDYLRKSEADFNKDAPRQFAAQFASGAPGSARLDTEEAIYTPPTVEAEKQAPPSKRERDTRLGIKPAPMKEPKTVEEYERKREAGELPPSPAAEKAAEEARNDFGWKAASTVKAPAGMTTDAIRAHEAAMVALIREGKTGTNMPVAIKPAEREAAINRVHLEAKRALSVAAEHEDKLLGYTMQGNAEDTVHKQGDLLGGAFTGGGGSPAAGAVKTGDEEAFKKAAQRAGFSEGVHMTDVDYHHLFNLARRRAGLPEVP